MLLSSACRIGQVVVFLLLRKIKQLSSSNGQNGVLMPALFVASSKSASLTLPNRT